MKKRKKKRSFIRPRCKILVKNSFRSKTQTKKNLSWVTLFVTFQNWHFLCQFICFFSLLCWFKVKYYLKFSLDQPNTYKLMFGIELTTERRMIYFLGLVFFGLWKTVYVIPFMLIYVTERLSLKFKSYQKTIL